MLIIIAYPPKFFQMSLKIYPKSFQNPSKTDPEPSQNPPRTLLKSMKNPKRAPKAPRTRFFRIFIDFLNLRGFQNRAKIARNRKKTMKNRCQKNTCFSTQFFLDFSWFGLPKTTPKSRFFRTFFENVDFVKIVVFL